SGTGSDDAPPRCPDCGRELSYTGECFYCLITKRAAGKVASPEPKPSLRRNVARTTIGVTVALRAIHGRRYLIGRYRSLRSTARKYARTRCPYCRRKLRFAAHRAGASGACPGCRRGILLKPAGGPVG